jgi:hypothetical protein
MYDPNESEKLPPHHVVINNQPVIKSYVVHNSDVRESLEIDIDPTVQSDLGDFAAAEDTKDVFIGHVDWLLSVFKKAV